MLSPSFHLQFLFHQSIFSFSIYGIPPSYLLPFLQPSNTSYFLYSSIRLAPSSSFPFFPFIYPYSLHLSTFSPFIYPPPPTSILPCLPSLPTFNSAYSFSCFNHLHFNFPFFLHSSPLLLPSLHLSPYLTSFPPSNHQHFIFFFLLQPSIYSIYRLLPLLLFSHSFLLHISFRPFPFINSFFSPFLLNYTLSPLDLGKQANYKKTQYFF